MRYPSITIKYKLKLNSFEKNVSVLAKFVSLNIEVLYTNDTVFI